ncbi:hypothetical protein CHS0354_026226 [Potamilus streckersoni]|uniref:Uncharacterized protein n=1 Tax=Potamilus streckersoni TaxID=2493646 RepID=A0AAE0W9S0_9BIVA|nr:hypothetical protein CHS0354_026226 [Potamilus streckersoni]
MRNREALKALCLIFTVFIKSMVAIPLYSNGLYEHWDLETNRLIYCREVLVKRGFEAVHCTENEAEDTIRKCQIGQYQPDETNSSSSPHCIAEPQCTEEGTRKDIKCIDGYCWTVCICSLETGKCGLDTSNCLHIKDIKCIGKILQDCSCASSVITSTLPTSPPTRSNLSTILKPINPDWTAKTSLPILTDTQWTDTTKNNDKIGVTTDGTDTVDEVRNLLIIISSSILVILVVSCLCIKFHKHCSNRPIGDHKESIEMLGSGPADRYNGLDIDKVSKATDSGVCGLSQGSNENCEPGVADPDSINLSGESDMESGRNMDNIIEDESVHEAGRGRSQSSCQIEVHKDSRHREETTLSEDKDSYQESDRLLNSNECADYPSMRDMSQQSDENCQSGETNPNNNLRNGLDDPDVTHCKHTSTSFSGTNLHHTDGIDAYHGTDPVLSLCQFDVKTESKQREKPIIVVKMEDVSLEEASLQEKKIAIVSPFMNEVQTVPVQDLPPSQDAENQPLQVEGSRFSSEEATADLFSNWSSFSNSIYYDSTNQ